MRRSRIVSPLLVVGLVFLGTAARADSTCISVTGENDGPLVQAVPFGPVEGKVTLALGWRGTHTVDITNLGTGGTELPSGIFMSTAEGTYTFEGGEDSLSFVEKDKFFPTDHPAVYRVKGKEKFTSGTGIFEDAFGVMHVEGEWVWVLQPGNWAQVVNMTFKGTICNID